VRIGIVGNSHAGALKQATTTRAFTQKHSHSFEFLVDPGGSAPRIEVRDGELFRIEGERSPRASATPGKVNPATCDAIFFCAAGLPAHRIGKPHHPLSSMVHAGFAPAPYKTHQSVSGEVLALSLERRLRELPNIQAFRIIRSVFAGPIVIFTLPMPSPRIDEGPAGEASDLPQQYGENVLPFIRWYYGLQARIIHEEARPLGAHVLLPPEPHREAGFTPEEFCLPDGWHMNVAYGRMMLDRAFALLGGV
jgi:hypothetical protein